MADTFSLQNKRSFWVAIYGDNRRVHLDENNIRLEELVRIIDSKFQLGGRRFVLDYQTKEGCWPTIANTQDLLHFLQTGIKIANITFLSYDPQDSCRMSCSAVNGTTIPPILQCSEVGDHPRLEYSQLPLDSHEPQESGLGKARKKTFMQHTSPYDSMTEFYQTTIIMREYGLFQRILCFEQNHNPHKTQQEHVQAAHRWMINRSAVQPFSRFNKDMEELTKPADCFHQAGVQNHPILSGSNVALPMFSSLPESDSIASADSASDIGTVNILSQFNNMSL